MKQARVASRTRISRETAELKRLALQLLESGGKLEDRFWETHLITLIDDLLHHHREEDLTQALEQLFETEQSAHDELADLIEFRAETCPVGHVDEKVVQLFAIPIVAWSRFTIPTCNVPTTTAHALQELLLRDVFAPGVHLSLANYLFSPDQLPHTFWETRAMTEALGQSAIQGEIFTVNPASMQETNRFLSDVRYLVGALCLTSGGPLFRWNSEAVTRDVVAEAWTNAATPLLGNLLAGCAWKLILPDAYHAACRHGDRHSRNFAIQASVDFLFTVMSLAPNEQKATIICCQDQENIEYRISFAGANPEEVFHGVLWPLLGEEDENTDTLGEITQLIRQAGVEDIQFLDQNFPMEFCEDCGAPMFPNRQAELVHPEIPVNADEVPQSMH